MIILEDTNLDIPVVLPSWAAAAIQGATPYTAKKALQPANNLYSNKDWRAGNMLPALVIVVPTSVSLARFILRLNCSKTPGFCKWES